MQEVAHQILRESESERASEGEGESEAAASSLQKKRPSVLTQSSSALCVSVALCLCHFLHRSPGAASGRSGCRRRSGCLLRLLRARSTHDCGHCSSVAPQKITENVRNGAADYVVVLFFCSSMGAAANVNYAGTSMR